MSVTEQSVSVAVDLPWSAIAGREQPLIRHPPAATRPVSMTNRALPSARPITLSRRTTTPRSETTTAEVPNPDSVQRSIVVPT